MHHRYRGKPAEAGTSALKIAGPERVFSRCGGDFDNDVGTARWWQEDLARLVLEIKAGVDAALFDHLIEDPALAADPVQRHRAAGSGQEEPEVPGRRAIHDLEPKALAGLDDGLRLVLFDTHCRDLAALDTTVSIPVHVEKTGHWLNVDGIRRDLGRARAPAAGIEPLERTLGALAELVERRGSGAEVGA